MTAWPEPYLAAVIRHRVVAAVLVGDGKVIDLARTLAAGPSSRQRIHNLVVGLAADYHVSTVLVEPGSRVGEALCAAPLALIERSLASAGERLLSRKVDHQTLTHHVLERLPVLSRFMNHFMCSSGRWFPDRSRLVIVLAAAIALAEQTRG